MALGESWTSGTGSIARLALLGMTISLWGNVQAHVFVRLAGTEKAAEFALLPWLS